MGQSTVLIVEDDEDLREALCDTLDLAGYLLLTAADGQEALEILDEQRVGLIVTDVRMEPMPGDELLRQVRGRYPDIPVLMMTAHGTIQDAVTAMQEGAIDYLVKPFEADALVEKVGRYVLPESVVVANDELVAEDAKTKQLLELSRRVAASDAAVLINGPSGAGKEVFAKYIHLASERNAGPFVAINCAAIPENMLEAILFGYEKGAYTGAHRSTPGKFEQAQGGTLLLDEVTEMPLALQAKLLRVLQEKEVERLGGNKAIALDVRILATTNRNLKESVADGDFREDLYFRLNVFPLQLPPLCERPGDVVPLTRHLLSRHVSEGQTLPELTGEAEQKLVGHSWPGNVRELENVVQRALILKNGNQIKAEDLWFEVGEPVVNASQVVPTSVEDEAKNLSTDLWDREQQILVDTLNAAKGSRKEAAERLGISPRTLRYKLAKLREAGVTV